jgi:hypothetical protein
LLRRSTYLLSHRQAASFTINDAIRQPGGIMKYAWMGTVVAAAMLTSGCSAVARAVSPNPGVGSAGHGAMIYKKGPVYSPRGMDVHSLADPVSQRPSPASAVGMARPPVMLGPDDSPFLEAGPFGIGVKGLSGTDVRRLGPVGYAKSWAESGLGRSAADIGHDPTFYRYVQLRLFPDVGRKRLLLY